MSGETWPVAACSHGGPMDAVLHGGVWGGLLLLPVPGSLSLLNPSLTQDHTGHRSGRGEEKWALGSVRE